MILRYCDRRKFIRVPVGGPVRWKSGSRSGRCTLVDISPGGAGLRMPIRKAAQLGPRVDLAVDVAPGVIWNLPADARVVRNAPDDDGECRIGVEFASERWS
jgi:hypothetical protein